MTVAKSNPPDPLWNISSLVKLGLFIAGLWGNPAFSKTPTPRLCASDPQVWAEQMTAQLPLFANLELTRTNASFRLILVSNPDMEKIPALELQKWTDPSPGLEAFRLYFSTLERRLSRNFQPNPYPSGDFSERETDTVRLAYRAYLVRSSPTDPRGWQLYQLEVTQAHLPVQDISNGAIAQGIRAWLKADCPTSSDLELTPPPSPR